MSQECLFRDIVISTSGEPYHGRVSGNKLVLLCPYCQANKKGIKARDAASAILPGENDGWKYWVFNCLKCQTRHRIDKFPSGMILELEKTKLSSGLGLAHTSEKEQVQRLPTEPISVQIGKGAWLDYQLNQRKHQQKPWWEKNI